MNKRGANEMPRLQPPRQPERRLVQPVRTHRERNRMRDLALNLAAVAAILTLALTGKIEGAAVLTFLTGLVLNPRDAIQAARRG